MSDTDWGKPCTETEACTFHNLHCSYPNCINGRAVKKQAALSDAPSAGDTITLRRDGIEATVKVGDVVPMTDGRAGTITEFNSDLTCARLTLAPVRHDVDKDGWWYGLAGEYLSNFHNHGFPAIDIAKLAEQQAALAAAPPSVPAEKLRAVVQRWQAAAVADQERADASRPPIQTVFITTAATYQHCVADVLKLLEDGNG